jgi:hypothetical protein
MAKLRLSRATQQPGRAQNRRVEVKMLLNPGWRNNRGDFGAKP